MDDLIDILFGVITVYITILMHNSPTIVHSTSIILNSLYIFTWLWSNTLILCIATAIIILWFFLSLLHLCVICFYPFFLLLQFSLLLMPLFLFLPSFLLNLLVENILHLSSFFLQLFLLGRIKLFIQFTTHVWFVL